MFNMLKARLCFAMSRMRGRDSLENKQAQEWWSVKGHAYLSAYIMQAHGYTLDDVRNREAARKARIAAAELADAVDAGMVEMKP